MQISRGVHTEMPAEGAVCAVATGLGAGVSGFGGAEGVQSGGGASDARPRAHAAERAAEVFGIECDGVYQREERDPHRAGVCWSTKELRWAAFWARGYWVSTVGKNEAAVRRYIQDQEKEDRRLEQLEMMAL
jgi:hypothetical protein